MRASLARALSISLALTLLPAAAEVYSWVDANNVRHYTDKPPAKDSKPIELAPLQTYSPATAGIPSPALPPASASSESAVPAATSAPAISITSPGADETIRDPEGRLSISLNASPKPGQGLIYFLDGQRQNKLATPSTAWLLEGVERGEHTLTATLVASDGRELAKAAPITFFMKPPTARR